MSSIAGAINARDIPSIWVKSSYSGPTGGDCVEVAFLDDGQVAMRNSRDPDGPALVFTQAEWTAFLGGMRDGQFARPA